ncbi:hypothetical protein HPB51_013157 [Rhipicephalus microplus]|uniref:Uncharacterized protein n=1 Tax=Rhipicephalus microplus TaxID=6941 RepID=A0A9J6E1I2_RHIMP|nr:hypothetical protein HPB51_013157 [Rhipicephalus microplus]
MPGILTPSMAFRTSRVASLVSECRVNRRCFVILCLPRRDATRVRVSAPRTPPPIRPPSPSPGAVTTRRPVIRTTTAVVGTAAAALKMMLPPDGDCDILIFTHVQVYNETVQAYYENRIFDTFKKVCAAYTRTTCGLSFAMRTLKEDSFSDKPVQDSVRDLQKKNRINHLGVLDAYGTAEEVNAGTATILPAVFSVSEDIIAFR